MERLLSDFVFVTTNGRDETHGHAHMKAVAQNAKNIIKHISGLTATQKKNALIVSWLHDVADHKYDTSGVLMSKMTKFVESIVCDQDAKCILQCIKMVSFSAEKKNGYLYYEEVLPPDWVIVRNIASDADKLEALGEIGIERCAGYARELWKQQHPDKPVDEENVLEHVWQHAQDKLLLLKTKYIHTPIAKQMAVEKHAYMVNWFATKQIASKDLLKYL